MTLTNHHVATRLRRTTLANRCPCRYVSGGSGIATVCPFEFVCSVLLWLTFFACVSTEIAQTFCADIVLFAVWRDPALIGQDPNSVDWDLAWRPNLSIKNGTINVVCCRSTWLLKTSIVMDSPVATSLQRLSWTRLSETRNENLSIRVQVLSLYSLRHYYCHSLFYDNGMIYPSIQAK